MGAGVADNRVFGRTGDDAMPLGWAESSAVDFSTDTQLLPDHMAAAVVKALGFDDASQTISSDVLAGLFT